MTWEEYYDKFYDWAESTQIKKLSSVDTLGKAEEVAEIMLEFALHHEEIVNRIAKKAIDQKLVFTAENIMDLTGNMDPELQAQLAYQSAMAITAEDLISLEGFLDEDVLVKLYKLKGLHVPEVFCDDDDNPKAYAEEAEGKKPGGFFSALAMAFGIGHGIHQGINDATRNRVRKFNVGDHVRVKYRGQEGIVIDINGDLYMVSLSDGGYVDSYTESQLERAW